LTRSKFCSRDLTTQFCITANSSTRGTNFFWKLRMSTMRCPSSGPRRSTSNGNTKSKKIHSELSICNFFPSNKISDGTVEKYDLLWRSDKMKHWVYDRVKPVFIEPETEYDQDWIEDHEGPLVWVFLGMKDANRSQQVYHMIKSNEQIFKKSVHTSNCLHPKKKSCVGMPTRSARP
jgi:hypothetical protein